MKLKDREDVGEGKEETYSFEITKAEAGQRLDVFLAGRQEYSLSRAQIKKAVASGLVLLNKAPVRAGQRLREGDEIICRKTPPRSYDVLPEDIPLTIVYEDSSLLVVDKPAGMVVHPAAGNYRGTLVNALLYHCRDLSGIGGVERPGIVHRLDKGTSGLLVVAKNDAAHRGLALQFKRHEVTKIYHALVYGDMKEEGGVIDAPVGRDVSDRKKISTRSRRGREARTYWSVCERFGPVSLLKVQIETGRTHQIRVHLTHAGHPIVGDLVYGGVKLMRTVRDPLLREKIKALSRPALHASSLSFTHPIDGRTLSFSSPLPEDMAALCEFMRCEVQGSR